MAPKGSVSTLYYVTKTTPKGKTYQNAFLKKGRRSGMGQALGIEGRNRRANSLRLSQ
jgi:hypothetical protein